MALYTDFFPSAEGNLSAGTPTVLTAGDSGFNIAAITNSTMAVLTRNAALPGTLAANDEIRFVAAGTAYTAQIISIAGMALTIQLDAPATIAAVTDNSITVQEITTAGTTTIVGDLIVGGGGTLHGDVVGDVTGDVTGNADTATTLATAQNFSIGQAAGTMSDITAAAISFNGSGGVDLQATIDDDAVDAAAIADDAVTRDHINIDVVQANGGLAANLTTGALQLASTLGGNGINLNNGVLSVDIESGSGLSFTAGGELTVASVSSNSALSFTTSTAQTEAAAKTAFVAAFNAATATVDGTNGGYTVVMSQALNTGDTVLLTFPDSDNANAATVESYIYTGPDAQAPADISEVNLVDLTHAGDVVESLALRATDPNIEFTGGPTGAITNLALTQDVGIRRNFDVFGDTVLGDTTAGGAVNINLGAADELTISGLDVGTGATLGTNTFLSIASDGTVQADTVSTTGTISGLTTGTIPVATAADDIGDSIITQAQGAGTPISVPGATNPGTATGPITAGNTITFEFYGEPSAAGVVVGATATVAGIALTLTQVFGGSSAATATVNLSIAQLFDIDTALQSATTWTNPGALSVSIAGAATVASGGLTVTAGGIDVTAGGIDITAGGLDVTGATTLDALTTNGAATIAGGQISLSAGTSELRVAGSGISSLASDTAPLALVVGADGHVMTGTAGSIGLVNVKTAVTTGTQIAVESGDLIVLPPLGATASANINLPFPSSPGNGSFVEIANLSATGAGSNGQFWTFGGAGDTVMGTALGATDPFDLDDATASFKFVFTGATFGWVIIGAN